jgi:hypothetical protein
MGLFHTTDLDGVSELKPDKTRLRAILSTLDDAGADDAPHPDVALINDESGWSLSVYVSGIVTFEQLDAADEAPRYMKNVSRDKALRLWLDLAAGRLDSIKALLWEGGPPA